MQKKSWADLPTGAKAAIIIGGIAEVALTRRALKDLRRRPKSQVRGSKKLWRLALVVQPVGPVAYLVAGRKR